LPFLSRTVTGKVTTFTSTDMVVTGAAGLWAAGGGAGGVEFCDPSAGARRRKPSCGEIRNRLMRTLDDASACLVTRMSKLFDIVRSFLEAMEGFRVVLNPELRTALLEVCFHGRAAGQRLLLIRLTARSSGSGPLCRIVP